MDQGADRRRALHGVRQPDVKRDLRRLAASAHEEKEGDGRHEARGQSSAQDRSVDRRKLRAADAEDHEEETEDEAGIADPVDQEGLLAGFGRRRLLEPEADEKIGAEADALPAHEHHKEVRSHDQDEHGKGEQVEAGEVARRAALAGHVSGGIDVDQEADPCDDQDHDRAQGVELERQRRLESAGLDPREQHLDGESAPRDRLG
jgi:hypothetical protein